MPPPLDFPLSFLKPLLAGFSVPAAAFNPQKSWKARYRTYCLVGNVKVPNGNIAMERSVEGEGSVLHVRCERSAPPGCVHILSGEVCCAADTLARPRAWRVTGDQLSLDTIQSHGGWWARTSNIDRLIGLPAPITEARRYGFAEYRGLRTPRYTYVCSIHSPWPLYDNQSDPYQMHNLIGKSDSSDLQARLNRNLDAELKRRKDGFLQAAEYFKRAELGHVRDANAKIGSPASPWGDWDSTLQPTKE